jgi:hypothetical protein
MELAREAVEAGLSALRLENNSQQHNEISQAANRVVGDVRYRVRAAGRVVGAESLEMGQALLPLSKRRNDSPQFLGW